MMPATDFIATLVNGHMALFSVFMVRNGKKLVGGLSFLELHLLDSCGPKTSLMILENVITWLNIF